MAVQVQHKVPVIIVGGGPAGLSMGMALAQFSVKSLIVEKNSSTSEHPKSRGTFVRTMEIFRRWGLAARLRARGLPDETDVFAFRTSIVGHEIGRTLPEPNLHQSPVWKVGVAQDAVEEELVRCLRSSIYPTIRFNMEAVSYKDLDTHVVVDIRNVESGVVERWEADYLIAADGAGSGMRRAAGIEMTGPSTLAYMLNEYWRGDLSNHPIAKEAAGIRVYPTSPDVPVATTLNTNGADRWLTVLRIGLDRDERDVPWNDTDTVRFLRRHVGIPDFNIQLINRTTWRVSKQVASSMRLGRMFLVGDAAHRFPPSGGFGMNTGIQDAHNLAWKLAFVLQGIASEALLDTYDVERRPVAQSNADWSQSNAHRIAQVDEAVRTGNDDRFQFWLDDFLNHTHNVGRGLGFFYEHGAIIPDGSVPPVSDSRFYSPTDRPGSRFPHFWVDALSTVSSIDWFDSMMTLIVGPSDEVWLDAGQRVAERLNITLQLKRLRETNREDGLGMGPRGAVLVRPDGHVAWRVAWPDSNAEELLSLVFARLLQPDTVPAIEEHYVRL